MLDRQIRFVLGVGCAALALHGLRRPMRDAPEEVEHWNNEMISRHPDSAVKKARFLHALKEAGGEGRKDIRTYFDLIEFDEGRLR